MALPIATLLHAVGANGSTNITAGSSAWTIGRFVWITALFDSTGNPTTRRIQSAAGVNTQDLPYIGDVNVGNRRIAVYGAIATISSAVTPEVFVDFPTSGRHVVYLFESVADATTPIVAGSIVSGTDTSAEFNTAASGNNALWFAALGAESSSPGNGHTVESGWTVIVATDNTNSTNQPKSLAAGRIASDADYTCSPITIAGITGTVAMWIGFEVQETAGGDTTPDVDRAEAVDAVAAQAVTVAGDVARAETATTTAAHAAAIAVGGAEAETATGSTTQAATVAASGAATDTVDAVSAQAVTVAGDVARAETATTTAVHDAVVGVGGGSTDAAIGSTTQAATVAASGAVTEVAAVLDAGGVTVAVSVGLADSATATAAHDASVETDASTPDVDAAQIASASDANAVSVALAPGVAESCEASDEQNRTVAGFAACAEPATAAAAHGAAVALTTSRSESANTATAQNATVAVSVGRADGVTATAAHDASAGEVDTTPDVAGGETTRAADVVAVAVAVGLGLQSIATGADVYGVSVFRPTVSRAVTVRLAQQVGTVQVAQSRGVVELSQ